MIQLYATTTVGRVPVATCYGHGMSLRLVPASVAVLAALTLAACSSPPESPEPIETGASNPPPGQSLAKLPECDQVTEAIGPIIGALAFIDGSIGVDPEGLQQSACMYGNDDETVRIGVTVTMIPFRTDEIEAFRTLPNAIDDDRAVAIGAVLQTAQVEEGPEDHLDSTLFVFDTVYSVAIQGFSDSLPGAETLPQLTVGASSDAAVAVHALVE